MYNNVTDEKTKAVLKSKPNKAFLIVFLFMAIIIALGFIPALNQSVTIANKAGSNGDALKGFGTILDSLKYEKSIHILAMLLVGFGFLMVFVRKHGYSSITATFLTVSIAIPFYMLIKSLGSGSFNLPVVNIDTLILAEFAAASLLIAIGAPLGRLKMDQYLVMALLFVPAYAFNEWIISGSGLFKGFLDTGGSVIIHAFGAYFGLGVVASTLTKFKDCPECENDSTSNQFCLIGSMVLWIFWPSFTSALVAPEQVTLTAVNTIFALCGATLATYVFTKMIRNKIEIGDIANAALAGGVAIGTTCNMVTPGYAMLIGIAAGALSTIGYTIISPKVQKIIRGTDTCGVHNLHGMPGILGGITGVFVTGNAGVQLGGILVTLVIALVLGRITGIIVNCFGKKELTYSDEDEFIVG